MDQRESARRKPEKAIRKPINDVTLNVHPGSIDINQLFRKIDERVKEKTNG